MNGAFYYLTLVEEERADEVAGASVSFDVAVRNAIEFNLKTSQRARVFYHSGLDTLEDFEVWPLNGLAGEYLR
jgi:hypothetical protein